MKGSVALLLVALSSSGICTEAGSTAHAPAPARMLPPATPEAMATVALSPESQLALGIETALAQALAAPDSSIVAGEVMVPPGRDIVLAAPTGGRIGAIANALPHAGERVSAGQPLLRLIPMAAADRNSRASADRDLAAARANYELSDARVKRALTLTMDGSVSQRSVEEAVAQRKVAHAEMKAAESRVRTISGGVLDADIALSIMSPVDGVIRTLRVAAGQSVPAGTALIDVAGTGRWVRAALTAGDAAAFAAGLDERQAATARRIGADASVPLALVLAAPSADPLRGSVDRFFVLPSNADWTPGERVLVELTTQRQTPSIAVPNTAVVRDAEGGAWVYEQSAPDVFRRRRVELIRRDGARYLVARGLAPDTRVVSVGAVELWGFELGADR
jgi:membrane fusion protein, heavy metal efflux system